jgi:alkylation response protein AidB-like acyl-CoA dehydrogenase
MFIDLLPTEDQAMIRDSVVSLCTKSFPIERLRKEDAIGGAAERKAWAELAEAGLFGLGLSTEVGGVGYSTAEEVVVAREFGRYMVSPLVLATMLATHVAAAAGNTALAEALTGGKIRVAFANPLKTVNLSKGETVEVQLLDYEKGDHVLLMDEKQAAVFDAGAVTVTEAIEGIDETVTIQRAKLNTGKAAALTPRADATLPRRMELLIASYATGMAEAARDMGVEYAKIRNQFGQPIGAFQAIKHACADMAVRAEAAMAQTFYAAATADMQQGDDLFEAACARLLACEGAVENAKANIQIHGGMGYTFECDAHLYLKRGHVMAQLDSSRFREQKRIMASETGLRVA